MSIGEHIADNFGKYAIGTTIAILAAVGIWEFGPGSRRTLNPTGTTLEYKLPDNFQRMINVSSGGSEADVMMTYETIDGKIITKEYNRMGAFETDIKWVKPSQPDK